MSVLIKDTDDVTTEHIPDRLEVNLIQAAGNIQDLELKIYFKVKTTLPSGKVVGEPYLDQTNPLLLNCQGDEKLTQAMLIIQRAIGQGRYTQITTVAAPKSETTSDATQSPI
ncbi:hypothetical protein [Microcoleus sp. D2_18a_B4]|uniref:hypothetical protein n=1 Tax=Microcoleus sp. D2_18a_B4 TaxID=3055329 RepID=UPI002FD56E15